jgi:type IV pilus biogenesis protein CpaD/CtpE
MTPVKTTLFVITLIIIAACTAKKSATTAAAPAPAATPAKASTPAPKDTAAIAKPANGVYAPGDEELAAIQSKYMGLTLDKLKEGYKIYTEGECTNCHRSKNIYRLDETRWKGILDDMAQRAQISDSKKDAVYKYVLSIKAVQPK